MALYAIITDENALDSYVETIGDLPSGWSSVELPEGFDPRVERYDPTASAVVPHVDQINAELRKALNLEREAAMQAFISDGPAKALVYAAKAGEARDYSALDQSARDALSTADELLRFPFLRMDADHFGDTMNDALTRFQDGISRSMLALADLEGAYQSARTGVLNAQGFDEKDAVATGWIDNTSQTAAGTDG